MLSSYKSCISECSYNFKTKPLVALRCLSNLTFVYGEKITYLLFFLSILTAFKAKAQIELVPKVIASSGAFKSVSNLELSWTVGETFITELTSSSLSLSQGFQQNTLICLSIVDYQYLKAGNPYQALFPLVNGMTINQIPEQVSIMVTDVCSNVTIGSFEMSIQGPQLNWNLTQNVVPNTPNTLFDNTGNNVLGRNFTPGSYTLTVTGYAQGNKSGGITYGPVITNFTVVGNTVTISTPTVSTPNICAGSNVDVTFAATGTFNAGNQFQVQLSGSDGSFTNPTTIGLTNAPGTVNCTIPLNTPEGFGYLIRVVSSNQVYTGNPSVSPLKVNPLNSYYESPQNDFLTANTEIKQVISTINATNKVGNNANVSYQAGKAVILTPGFETQTGSIFKAQIQACTNN